MASIMTAIQLQDNFSNVLYDVVSSVNLAIQSMYDMQQAVGADMDMSSIDGARESIDEVTMALNRMGEAAQRQANMQIPQPEPVQPVGWKTVDDGVFMTSGIERFKQEAASANAMLERLSGMQHSIANQAHNIDIIPQNALYDIHSMTERIDAMRSKIEQLENSKLNFGTSEANDNLEHLRQQLSQAVTQQEELNAAMQNADISAANAAYAKLSQTVGNTERYIRDNIESQERFNQEIRAGTDSANTLMDKIRGIGIIYLSIHGGKGALDASDELTQTISRIDLMRQSFNEAGVTTQGLMDSIYKSAQDARGSFVDMSGVVARFGNNAKDAFGSTEEVVRFANLIQKQLNISGATAEESASALLQLSQAMGSGVLRGEELNSIFKQAPNLIQNIADYLDVPIGQIREMASEGELSTDVVKQAIFSAADEIDARFAEMPMTWAQLWNKFENDSLRAFQPVLERINEIANNEQFQTFVNGAVNALAMVSGAVLDIFNVIGQFANYVVSNWSVISPYIYGVAAAILALSAAQIVCSIATGIMTAAFSPMFWIGVLIALTVSKVITLSQKIADMTGIATTGLGVIAGAVNVVIAYFKNFGLMAANIALGIWNVMKACAHNIKVAFENEITNTQLKFCNFFYLVINGVIAIAEALNKLPFINFDYSGLEAKANEYAEKMSELEGKKRTYTDIGAAFDKGMNTYDATLTFGKDQAAEAFKEGAEWGDNAAKSLKDKLSGLLGGNKGNEYEYNPDEGFGGGGNPLSGGSGGGSSAADNLADAVSGIDNIAANTGSTAADTARIADTIDITDEDLKYLRDIAERDIIDRTVFTKVEVNMGGITNEVHGMTDLNEIADGINTILQEQICIGSEG